VIVLLDAGEPGSLVQLDVFVDAFIPHVAHGALVVGVGRTDAPNAPSTDAFAARLDARGIVAPVLSVDVRKQGDVMMLVRTLVCILGSHTAHGAPA
jgi:hypothetical protein